MVERLKTSQKLIQEVGEIYAWLDSQIGCELSSICDACGKCCDFIAFDHRLFVTVPELIYAAASLNVDTLKPMPTGICPYNIEGKCKIYKYRFSGCRIFNCKADPDMQSELSEAALVKLKEISAKYNIPYRYMELAASLNSIASD